jgi:hypothetical protein
VSVGQKQHSQCFLTTVKEKVQQAPGAAKQVFGKPFF